MNNLTEKWKSGGLEKNKKYYTTDKLGRSYIKTYNKKGFKGLVHEVLASVPSYEEWQPFTDTYFNGLTTKEIAELAKKSIRLTKQHCEDNAEIEKLKELLQKCKVAFKIYANEDETCGLEEENKYAKHLLTKIDEVLK